MHPVDTLCNELRNKVTKMIREAETNYWTEQFNAAATSAEFWKIVKKLKREQKERKIGLLTNEEGSIITNDTEKAELLNSYVTNIGKELSDNLNFTYDDSDMTYISRITPT